MTRHNYRITLTVDHIGREQAIKTMERLFRDAQDNDWREESHIMAGIHPRPRTVLEVGPIAPSLEERVARIEEEFEIRLGGLSEDAA